MCRLLAYIGSSTSLERLLYKPEHSLIVQSYQPREMLSGVVNADGFGVGWYDDKNIEAFTYRNILPIWNDVNLLGLSRYINSRNLLAYVRSATLGQALDFSNCQPFQYQNLLFIHNGKIDNFKKTLYREIRSLLSDIIYNGIAGTTDSEHIFSLILDRLQKYPHESLKQSLYMTLLQIKDLAQIFETNVLANLIISNGKSLIASRYATKSPAPSLYWLQNSPEFPNSVIIASEPLFDGNWHQVPENSIITVGEDCGIGIEQI
jgi:ergothioneine biosynthesis protein EgtC